MKPTKKLVMSLLSAVWLLMLFTIPANAADCTCGKSTRPHDRYSHNKEWESDETTHKQICETCIINGHDEDCAQVVLVATEKHTFGSPYMGANEMRHECSACGYAEKFPCDHSNAKWMDRTDTLAREGYSTTADRCIKWCADCLTVVKTKKHKWTYSEDSDDKHASTCKDCGYSGAPKKHSFKYTYKQFKQTGVVSHAGDLQVPTVSHSVTKKCKVCGYSRTTTEAHTFKSNKCTACKVKKTILKAPASASGKRSGKVRTTTTKVPEQWIWTGKRWIHREAGSYKTYHYTVKASWKKVKNAAGYVYSFDNPFIKAGNYVTDTFGNEYGENAFTRKTSVTVKLSSTQKLKSTTLYVAAVSKNGWIGKVKKVKINIK